MTFRVIIWCAVSTVAQADEDEKYSLPSQEADARAVCAREGWQVVDVMRVPGHSRDYKSLDKLASDAAVKGIDAFHKLIEHLEKCDFDVLICRDANRFARRASLMSYIIESIVDDCGRRIYSLNDGWVDKQNAGMFAAMKGYSAAQDIKFLVEARKRGIVARAERGLLTHTPPMSHVTIRDDRGKAIRVEVREDRRQLWTDIGNLILEGVSWRNLEQELYKRFGHTNDKGRSFGRLAFLNLIASPTFWGHTALYRHRRGAGHIRGLHLWVFDETEPVPDGVVVYRNSIPPVWTGDFADRIKAELRRRHSVVGGRTPAYTKHRYSGVFVCGSCGGPMSVAIQEKRVRGVRCSRKASDYRTSTCKETMYTSIAYLDEAVEKLITAWLEGQSLEILHPNDQENTHAIETSDRLENEIKTVEQQLDRLIYEQSLQPESAQGRYRTVIGNLSDKLEVLKASALKASVEAEKARIVSRTQNAAFEDIQKMTLEGFWALSPQEINQYLHRILGNRRLVILNKKIIGSVEYKRNRHRRRAENQ